MQPDMLIVAGEYPSFAEHLGKIIFENRCLGDERFGNNFFVIGKIPFDDARDVPYAVGPHGHLPMIRRWPCGPTAYGTSRASSKGIFPITKKLFPKRSSPRQRFSKMILPRCSAKLGYSPATINMSGCMCIRRKKYLPRQRRAPTWVKCQIRSTRRSPGTILILISI